MSRSVRVLCVDGEGGDGQPLAGDLERGRLDVVTEMGMDDALERLGSSRFDCVVSTYRLPDGNGLEFLRSVREDHPRLPFVLVTDEGSEAVASEAIEAGVTDYRDALLDEPAPFVERVTDTVAEYRGARDAAERLQVHEAIVETVSILLCTADGSATVTGVRGRASDDAGIDPDAAVGRAVSDLFDGNPAVVDGYETALDGGETAAEVEIGERTFQAWVQPLGAATDDTSGAVLLAVDITGRRDHEAELEKRNERLERVASVISHDLRGPLRIAQGHLELAQETGEAASFERAREAQGRIGTIIEDVLTLARTGQMITETERTELDDIAREAWKTVDTSSITLVVDGNCEMDAAPARLRQLFESLFRNAVAHGATDDASDAAGSGVTVTVGSIEVMPTSTRATTDGTGFGLAIVSQTAAAHGWEVSVTESYQGGARFEFTGPDFRQTR